MGNSATQQRSSGFNYLPRLGMTKIDEAIDAQTNEIFSIIKIKKPVHDQDQLVQWKKRVERIDNQTIRSFLFLPLCQTFEKIGFCGSTGTVQIIYEDFTYVFENQIDNRSKTKQYFSENELWQILFRIAKGGIAMQKINRRVGSIHPSNVLMNKKGEVRIICNETFPEGDVDTFSNLLTFEDLRAYLAPQELQSTFSNNGVFTNIDACKAEVFSIGMTILSAASLQKLDYLYDNVRCTINTQLLEQLIVSVSKRYSLTLAKILALMLAIRPQERLKCSDIINIKLPSKQISSNIKQIPLIRQSNYY